MTATTEERLDLQRMTEQEIQKVDPAFTAWLIEVNTLCVKKTGLSIFDLSDWAYWDSWNDGDTPAQAVAAVIEYENSY